MENLLKEVEQFRSLLGKETDFDQFLKILFEIASRFSLKEEDKNLNGCFSVLLGLVEQYTHELLVKSTDHVQPAGVYSP